MNDTSTPLVTRRVLIDLDRCIECRSCAAACYYSHPGMPAVRFARSGWAMLPMICRQCKAASCVAACPVEAMVRDDAGVVRRKLARCIGCGSCARACPFGVLPSELGGEPRETKSPSRVSGHQVAKCDLCADRVGTDDGVVPRCVSACPAGALMFADEHNLDESLQVVVVGGRTVGESPFRRR